MASFPLCTPSLHFNAFVAGKFSISSWRSALIVSSAETPSVRVNVVVLSSCVRLNALRIWLNNSWRFMTLEIFIWLKSMAYLYCQEIDFGSFRK